MAATWFHSLSAAGFAATAISYGPARMGFGLFVPEFRTTFDLSSAAVGVISSLGFAGFFLGLAIAQALLGRRGPLVAVAAGLTAATAGMALVALAPGRAPLALGVVVAASSAGFAWTPFNDAVHRKIRDADRPAALSLVSTGTAVGIMLAGLAALGGVLAGLSWRMSWAAFAVVAAVGLVANCAALHPVGRTPAVTSQVGFRAVLRGAAWPLFAVALVYGTTSAVFLSFAADHLQSAGGLRGLPDAATPALVFMIHGLCGLTGLMAGRLAGAIGLPWVLRLVMLAGAGSLAILAPGAGGWAVLIPSAGLQGVHVMMTSAVLAFWSERLFPTLPALSFTAALLATAAGSVLGPALAGAVAQVHGAGVMFLGTAVPPAVLAAVLWDRHVRERPLA